MGGGQLELDDHPHLTLLPLPSSSSTDFGSPLPLGRGRETMETAFKNVSWSVMICLNSLTFGLVACQLHLLVSLLFHLPANLKLHKFLS